MIVCAIRPAIAADAFLAGAQFVDAFAITVPLQGLTARGAAERMFNRSPWWVTGLTRLRDLLVAPFGITTAQSARRADVAKIGFFPLISETPERVVAGFDDKHLDFRVVIDVAAAEGGQRITATTIVLMHNWLGHLYLTLIKPFHCLVVRAMLKQVRRAG